MTHREMIELASPWRFCPDPHGDGESLGFWRADRTFANWREAPVPSCFEACCPGLDFYEGVCWYRRSFRVPSRWQGRRVALRFEAVNYRARVWLNGRPAGENRDGFLPFEFDVTDTLRWDSENTLAVSVDNAPQEGDVPGRHVGWRPCGGIIREVLLRAFPPVHLGRLRVLAAPDGQGGRVALWTSVRNDTPFAAVGTVKAVIEDSDGRMRLSMQAPSMRVEPGTACDVYLEGRVENIVAWSPTTPVLYRAVACLSFDGLPGDELATDFGFRRIEATPQGLLLNGRPIVLTGFNLHEDSPQTGMASDLATRRRDLELMKEAGANFVRLAHYPHHPATLDLCDRLGLLALGEIPLYFWADPEEGRRTQAARVESAGRQLERMIERDFNHPSLVIWSVSNETPEGEPGVADGNRALVRRARQLDPSRLCVHVMNRWEGGNAQFDEDDVVCINTYPTMDFEARGHHPETFDLEAAVARQRARMDALHRAYPTKPILITEFGYCSFAGTTGHAFGEDEHARSLKAEFASFDAPYICGATIWCWADHPWPAGRFFKGLAVSPFGVVSRDRRPLAPYRTAREMFRVRQGLPAPPAPAREGTWLVMTRALRGAIPEAVWPEGFTMRPMSLDDIGLWTDIQRDAEPGVTIPDTLFRDEFGGDLEAIRWRCFIATDRHGLGVGTISAWYDRDFEGEDVGCIRYLAIRPRFRGLGLAKAALACALQRLAEWHQRCCLAVSAENAAAIRLFLRFGFEPALRSPEARADWKEICERLGHTPATDGKMGGRKECASEGCGGYPGTAM